MVGPTYNRALEVRLDRRVLHINKSVLDVRCIDSGLLVAVHINSGPLNEINIDSGLLDVRHIDSDLLGILHTNSCLLGIGHFTNGLLDVGIINRTVVCGEFTRLVLPSPTPFLLFTEMRLFALGRKDNVCKRKHLQLHFSALGTTIRQYHSPVTAGKLIITSINY